MLDWDGAALTATDAAGTEAFGETQAVLSGGPDGTPDLACEVLE